VLSQGSVKRTLTLKGLAVRRFSDAQKSTENSGEGCGRHGGWTLDIAIFGIFGKRMKSHHFCYL